MIIPIRELGDPVLRQPAREVTEFDPTLRKLADDMAETMFVAEGVGLAGPQVGVSLRVFVYALPEEEEVRLVANPQLSDLEGVITSDEGCLSIPGPFYPTSRAERVTLWGLDLEGKEVRVEAEGLLARIFQHETDHLNGTLYIDRLDEEGRKSVIAELRNIQMGLTEPRKKSRSG
jgi:peptide deformylase